MLAQQQPSGVISHASTIPEEPAVTGSPVLMADVGEFLRQVASVEGDPCFWTAMGELHRNQLKEKAKCLSTTD